MKRFEVSAGEVVVRPPREDDEGGRKCGMTIQGRVLTVLSPGYERYLSWWCFDASGLSLCGDIGYEQGPDLVGGGLQV